MVDHWTYLIISSTWISDRRCGTHTARFEGTATTMLHHGSSNCNLLHGHIVMQFISCRNSPKMDLASKWSCSCLIQLFFFFFSWKVVYGSYDASKIHLIGHSLGAHLMGHAGERIPGISRITGRPNIKILQSATYGGVVNKFVEFTTYDTLDWF